MSDHVGPCSSCSRDPSTPAPAAAPYRYCAAYLPQTYIRKLSNPNAEVSDYDLNLGAYLLPCVLCVAQEHLDAGEGTSLLHTLPASQPP